MPSLRSTVLLLTLLPACGGPQGVAREALECLPPGGVHTAALPPGSEPAILAAARRCDGGVGAGCTALATRYQQGDGVPPDPARAKLLFAQGCTAEDGQACLSLAQTLQATGAPSAEVNELLITACDLGHHTACGEAAQRLYNASTQHEPATLARMGRKGCDADVAQACLVLGVLYAYGQGVPMDMEQARKRLLQACSGGIDSACDLLESF